MRTFSDLNVFAAFLMAKAAELPAVETAALKEGAEIIREDAKHRIGEYQEGWAPLSGATLDGFYHPLAGWIPGKTEEGYAPPDNPLLRVGALRESIDVTVSGREAAIGSPEQAAVWQEMGTPNALYPIPPRPFLGPAGFKNAEAVAEKIGEAVTRALGGATKP